MAEAAKGLISFWLVRCFFAVANDLHGGKFSVRYENASQERRIFASANYEPKKGLKAEKQPMYVCNCNGVTRREVSEAMSAGAASPEDVLAHHGCEPCCGQCLPEIAEGLASVHACGGTASRGSLVGAE